MTSTKPPHIDTWWAATLDGRTPGEDGHFNYTTNIDRDYVIADAANTALRENIDMTHMRIFHMHRAIIETHWIEEDNLTYDQDTVAQIMDELTELDTTIDKLPPL